MKKEFDCIIHKKYSEEQKTTGPEIMRQQFKIDIKGLSCRTYETTEIDIPEEEWNKLSAGDKVKVTLEF